MKSRDLEDETVKKKQMDYLRKCLEDFNLKMST